MSEPIIEPKDLQPADILQFHGNSFVNRAIQLFDNGHINHSAMWTGKSVASAETNGYVELGLEQAITDTDVYVEVYRWCADHRNMRGTALGTKDYPYEPVQEQVKERLSKGLKYNYPAIVLLMGLGEIRRIMEPDIFTRMKQDKFAQQVFDTLLNANLILKEIYEIYSQGKELDICSQTVYSNFFCAGDKYKITITPNSMADCFGKILAKKLDESEFLINLNTVRAQESGISAYFVTPNDLAMSPNVSYYLGRLKFGHLNTTEVIA